MKSPFLSSKSAYIPLRNVDEEGEVVDRDEIKQPERSVAGGAQSVASAL